MSTMEICGACGSQIHGEDNAWVDNSGGDVCGVAGGNEPHAPMIDWVAEWVINEEATTPLEAARGALDTMGSTRHLATVFTVHGDVPHPDGTIEPQRWQVDLTEGTVERLPVP